MAPIAMYIHALLIRHNHVDFCILNQIILLGLSRYYYMYKSGAIYFLSKYRRNWAPQYGIRIGMSTLV